MNKLESLHNQHVEILTLSSRISENLNLKNLNSNPDAILQMLSRLAGLLKMHLNSEDSYLYPLLLKNPDPGISNKAKAFTEELGELRTLFINYQKKWMSRLLIEKAPLEFVQETNHLFKLIRTRINREEVQLFALISNS